MPRTHHVLALILHFRQQIYRLPSQTRRKFHRQSFQGRSQRHHTLLYQSFQQFQSRSFHRRRFLPAPSSEIDSQSQVHKRFHRSIFCDFAFQTEALQRLHHQRKELKMVLEKQDLVYIWDIQGDARYHCHQHILLTFRKDPCKYDLTSHLRVPFLTLLLPVRPQHKSRGCADIELPRGREMLEPNKGNDAP